MAATVFTSAAAADLNFGITNETAILLTSYSRNVTSNKTEVMDADGDVVAVAYSGKRAEITLEGYVNGSVAWTLAGTLSLSNDTSSYGVTGGTVIVNSINSTTGQAEFEKISVNATQYTETLS